MPQLTPITGALGKERAAHLLRRATFGPTKESFEQFAQLNIAQALDLLLAEQPEPAPPIDPETGSTWLPKAGDSNSDELGLFSAFKAWNLEQMRTSGTTLTERMTFFYHTHLPADHTLIRNTSSLYYQNALYRKYALGNFKELFTKVCADNAMLVYIDNTLNDVDAPNENFAREMMELYTIGKGPQIGDGDYTNYTEHDVQQAARVLTGLTHSFDFEDESLKDPETDLPRGYYKSEKVTLGENETVEVTQRHDSGEKVFSDKFQQTIIAPKPELMHDGKATVEGAWDEIDQMMTMIFDQDETARFICRKLYRFFVYYKITDEVEQNVIVPLAETFKTNNYEIKPVLAELFSSEYFYDENKTGTSTNVRGAQIKSPIELTLGTLNMFGVDFPSDEVKLYGEAYSGILESLGYQGINFYSPIDVAGYPPYHQTPAYNRNWISPNYLARRYEFMYLLTVGQKDENEDLLYKLDVVPFVENNISDPADAPTLVQELIELLFTHEVPTTRYEYFLNDILLDQLSEAHWTTEWNDYAGSGDDSGVRVQLERLIVGMLQTPEYQLY